MKLLIKSLLLATTFGVTCVAHAVGLTDAVDPSALAACVKQAQEVKGASAQAAETPASASQAQARSVQLAALPSTAGESGKAATAPPPLNADRAILDQLIEMNTTLIQLLQLEQAKASSGSL